MIRNSIATAVLALAAIGAQAHGTSVQQSGAVQGDVSGQLTAFQGSGNVGVSSISTGSSVSAGEVLGNGGFQEQAAGVTGGISTGSLAIAPGGIQSSTFTQQSSMSTGSGSTWGNVPVSAADGSIITGNQAFGSVNTSAISEGTFATQAVGANLAVQANGAIEANNFN